jgi:hypothetical protein
LAERSAVTCGGAGDRAHDIDGASEPYNGGPTARRQLRCQRIAPRCVLVNASTGSYVSSTSDDDPAVPQCDVEKRSVPVDGATGGTDA